MVKLDLLELLFIATVVLILTALPYYILTYASQDSEKTIKIAGYNLADEDPGVWLVHEGRWDFSKKSDSEIRVKQGETVALRITSMDVVHGFKLPGYNISEVIYPGEVKMVKFVADKSGEFLFYCSVPSCGLGHINMTGKLVVEPR
ncbi:MAG: hypothetical protein ACE5PM_06900 [Candidatus Hydrothermarchaeales archaeon]